MPVVSVDASADALFDAMRRRRDGCVVMPRHHACETLPSTVHARSTGFLYVLGATAQARLSDGTSFDAHVIQSPWTHINLSSDLAQTGAFLATGQRNLRIHGF